MKKHFFARFLTPSTLTFWLEAKKTTNYSLFDMLHGYIYARWPYLYLSIGLGEHRLSKAWVRLSRRLPEKNTGASKGKPSMADTYHGKVVPLEAAKQLVMVKEDVRITNLENIIPYPTARDIILQNPDHIVALECPCRAARSNPCLPIDVCLIVGEPFASFVAEHHPRRSRQIDSSEAVMILQQEANRGHVHHAFFKDAMLGRFYAICNCCECCCGAMQSQRNGTPMLASSGYLAEVDLDICTGCATCESYCQFGALSVLDQAEINREACMGCGVCVSKCPYGALELVHDPSKSEPLIIQNLMSSQTTGQAGISRN
jgi:ferredoxin